MNWILMTMKSTGSSDQPQSVSTAAVHASKRQFDELSENTLGQMLREFRREATAELSESSPVKQREAFSETPETQRHSRWHVEAIRSRGIDTHSERLC